MSPFSMSHTVAAERCQKRPLQQNQLYQHPLFSLQSSLSSSCSTPLSEAEVLSNMLATCSSSSNHHAQDFTTNLANLVGDSTQISSQGRFHQGLDLLLDGNLPTKSDPDQIYSMDIHKLNWQTDCFDSGVSKGGGLMRYNSAPSSILADYTHFDGILNVASEMDFPPLFPIDDDASSSSSSAVLIPHHLLQHNNSRRRRRPHTTREDMNHSSVLSAILEHIPSPHMPTHHYDHLPASDSSDLLLPEGLIMADNAYLLPPQQQQKRNKLIRHSSSPAGLLNHLASEVQIKNEPNNTNTNSNTNSNTNNGHLSNLCYPDAIMEHASEASVSSHSQSSSSRGVSHSYDDIFCPSSSPIIISPPSQSGIMRQSSLPLGIMSKLTLESICEGGDKMISSSGNSTDDANLGLLYGSFSIMNNGMQDEAARRRRMDAHGDSLTGHMNCLGMAVEINLDSASASSSVLCKARAKRGCATHPRSIAERVRRTKISEKMKKLQDLIPNIDKQANTADMLDEAVEYIKTLQHLVEELTISQSKCDGSCKNRQKNSP